MITLDRDTYKYHLKRGNRILQSGITNDLERREGEHQREYGDDVHITQVGRRTTRPAARDWEDRIKKKALRKPLRPGLTVFSVMIGTFFYCRWLLIILLCHNELKDERGGV